MPECSSDAGHEPGVTSMSVSSGLSNAYPHLRTKGLTLGAHRMGSAIILAVSPCNQRVNATVSVVLPIFIELKIDWQWQFLAQHQQCVGKPLECNNEKRAGRQAVWINSAHNCRSGCLRAIIDEAAVGGRRIQSGRHCCRELLLEPPYYTVLRRIAPIRSGVIFARSLPYARPRGFRVRVLPATHG